MRTRALGLVTVLLLAACTAPRADGPAPIGCATGEITAQGSSAQATAVSAWIKDYQVACAAATISYASVGSGAGVKAFAVGTGDFAGTDSVLSAADRAATSARCAGGTVVHLPMVVGPIALAYNVAGLAGLRLSPATVAGIFDGRVTAWNAAEIRRDNPGAVLPATRIRPVHRGDSSGTTDNFTRFLAATAGWRFPAGSAWPPAAGGVAAKGSNRVVAEIERSDGAIGYVEASYARFHNLPTAVLGNAAGEFAALTDEAAARTVAGARTSGDDLQLTLDYRTAAPGAYPLVLVTYEIVCGAGSPPLVKSFLTYASSPAGQSAAARLGYAPLPAALRTRVAAAVAGLRTS